MKPELEKLSMAFIANRDIVKEAFRGCNSDVYAACANLFCACGRIADKERLNQCRKVITEQTGLFSKFRGKLSPILSCMLALGENPEEQVHHGNLGDDKHLIRPFGAPSPQGEGLAQKGFPLGGSCHRR